MVFTVSVSEWNKQFERQARCTKPWRLRLYRQAGLWQAHSILDIGCGTGVITKEIAEHTKGEVTGMDIDPAMIEQATLGVERVTWKVGDAHSLPFEQGRFDIVICNFLLLWVQDPEKVVREMMRVVKRGGVVLDTAEPDYGGRIDFPEGLDMGVTIGQALQQSGGDPYIGRKLRKLFVQAGLISEVGIITSLWDQAQVKKEFADEWSFWELLLKNSLSSQELNRRRKMAEEALRLGWYFIFMPIFYALGRK